ncbi:hypothetical protein PIB30_089225, partial [Stylosanthes scabra]|nr:hypothetical protein [Stylosanthes scabra]
PCHKPSTPRRPTQRLAHLFPPYFRIYISWGQAILKFGVGSLDSSTLMASSSAPVSVFDEYRFRKEFNQQLFESHARRRKIIPEVGFNLDEDEYPQIMEQIMLRGWRRLAAPQTSVSKLLVQEFYANAAISDEEAAEQVELPYKSFVRGVKVDFSPNNIRRVMRFKRETTGAETDYKTRQVMDRLERSWQIYAFRGLHGN